MEKLNDLIQALQNLPYPNLFDSVYNVSRTIESKGKIKTVLFIDQEKFDADKAMYHDNKKNLENDIKHFMFEYLNINDNPKKELLFEKAYKLGYSENWNTL